MPIQDVGDGALFGQRMNCIQYLAKKINALSTMSASKAKQT
jgi:hypothetical protein